jgi:hypothetical protein
MIGAERVMTLAAAVLVSELTRSIRRSAYTPPP